MAKTDFLNRSRNFVAGLRLANLTGPSTAPISFALSALVSFLHRYLGLADSAPQPRDEADLERVAAADSALRGITSSSRGRGIVPEGHSLP